MRPVDVPQEEWEPIKIQRKQGIYLVVIGIVWWGMSLTKGQTTPESIPEWKGMVDDVRSVLECWASPSPSALPNLGGTKRKRDNASKGASKGASKRRRK